ncbi:MAG: ArsR/SmtB family transcription factor [Pseudooceanicola sp.]
MEKSPALAALSALAHDTRLDIVRLLVRHRPGGMPAGSIAQAVNTSASGLTFHLKLLEQADLITARRDGRKVIYALNCEQMGGLVHYLISDCCANAPEVRDRCRLHGGGQNQSDDAAPSTPSGTLKI